MTSKYDAEDLGKMWTHIATYGTPRTVCNIEQLNRSIREVVKKASTGAGPLQQSWYYRYQLLVWKPEELPVSCKNLPVGTLPKLTKQDARKTWKFLYSQEWLTEMSRQMLSPAGAPTSKNSPPFSSPTSRGAAQQFIASPSGTIRTFLGNGEEREVIENVNQTAHAISSTEEQPVGDFPSKAPEDDGVDFAGDIHDTRYGSRGASPASSPVDRTAPDWKKAARATYKDQRSKPKDKHTMKGSQNYWKAYDKMTDYDEQ